MGSHPFQAEEPPSIPGRFNRGFPAGRRRGGALARKDALAPARRDPQPPPHRRLQRAHRGAQPPREEGEARRPRLPLVRQLPATDPAPCRGRSVVGDAAAGAAHQNPYSPPKPEAPSKRSRCEACDASIWNHPCPARPGCHRKICAGRFAARGARRAGQCGQGALLRRAQAVGRRTASIALRRPPQAWRSS